MLTFQTTKHFPLDSESLFKFFSQPDQLEKWCAPDSMSLKLPVFDFKVGGNYRYEHTSQDGTFVAEGEFTEITPQKKIVQLDKTGVSPQGEKIFENLECVIEFQENLGGTEVYITQSGFKDEKSLEECRQGWDQCLSKLQEIVAHGPNVNTGKSIDLDARF